MKCGAKRFIIVANFKKLLHDCNLREDMELIIIVSVTENNKYGFDVALETFKNIEFIFERTLLCIHRVNRYRHFSVRLGPSIPYTRLKACKIG